MNIKWTIEKKLGNFRPLLSYEITLQGFEKKLAVATVEIVSDIAQPPEPRNRFCLPNTNEREAHWKPAAFHLLSTPGFRRGVIQDRILLPFVCTTEFVEVENSFTRLRAAFEKEMQRAKSSESILIRKELRLTEEISRQMAREIAAHKMLQLVAG